MKKKMLNTADLDEEIRRLETEEERLKAGLRETAQDIKDDFSPLLSGLRFFKKMKSGTSSAAGYSAASSLLSSPFLDLVLPSAKLRMIRTVWPVVGRFMENTVLNSEAGNPFYKLAHKLREGTDSEEEDDSVITSDDDEIRKDSIDNAGSMDDAGL